MNDIWKKLKAYPKNVNIKLAKSFNDLLVKSSHIDPSTAPSSQFWYMLFQYNIYIIYRNLYNMLKFLILYLNIKLIIKT